MRRMLITGSNRGIGLGLVEHYLRQDDTLIYATCRSPEGATTLAKLAGQHPQRVEVIQLDVADSASIQKCAQQIAAEIDGLDLLINNAGILPVKSEADGDNTAIFGVLDTDAILRVLHVNTVAPVIIVQAFAGLLRKGEDACVVNVSSDAGSLALKAGGGDYSYPASKAALNMMTRCLSGDFRSDNVAVVAIHPGWVQTDMGGPNASLPIEEAIPDLVRVIDGLTMADSGTFLNWRGEPLPW